jgi:hypothetical protein
MTESDYTTSEAFIQEYINPNFNKAILKKIIDAAGETY